MTTTEGNRALQQRLLEGERATAEGINGRSMPLHTRSSAIPTLEDAGSLGNGDRDGASSGEHADQLDAEVTFRYMTQRRLMRRYRGVYKQYSFASQLVTWVIVIYTLSILATLAFGANYATTEATSTTSDSVFYMAIVLAVVYVFVQLALLIRWMVYWAIVAAMVTYAMTGEISSVFWLEDPDSLSATQLQMRKVVTILLVIAEAVTVAVYLFTHHVYPHLVLANKIDTMRWWDVKHHPTVSNTLTYRSKARSLYTKKRNAVSYCGGLDEQHRPHGYGMWSDTSFHGERLTGQWDHGIPIGPFRSFEHGSGYCFVNIRIGYCHIRAEERPDVINFWPGHSQDGAHWGVASVECSVSGGFFKFLPAVRHLTPYNGDSEDTPRSAADCVPLLESPTDDVVFTDTVVDTEKKTAKKDPVHRRVQSAYRMLHKENSAPILELSQPPDSSPLGSSSIDSNGKEALVLLHGYNCSLNYGMNRLAQLLALGDYPTSIHPFVFSWPSGGSLAYFQARDTGSQNDTTARYFQQFLRSLVDAGYTTIHIIAHSMGARVYCHALHLGLLDDVFAIDEHHVQDEVASPQGKRRARLATLTFTNAEYERDEFVRRGGSYDQSRRFCRVITVYADNMDGALFFCEIFSKKSVFGPLNYSLGKRGHMIHRDTAEESGNQTTDLDMSDKRQRAGTEMDLAIALVNQRGRFQGVASFAYNRSRPVDPSLHGTGHVRLLSSQDEREFLDVDVIDTTWMDNNVHSIRHNYFNLNPTLVDDLRRLVVHKQRAASRPGLLKTNDNVYIFLVAPSHIKNK